MVKAVGPFVRTEDGQPAGARSEEIRRNMELALQAGTCLFDYLNLPAGRVLSCEFGPTIIRNLTPEQFSGSGAGGQRHHYMHLSEHHPEPPVDDPDFTEGSPCNSLERLPQRVQEQFVHSLVEWAAKKGIPTYAFWSRVGDTGLRTAQTVLHPSVHQMAPQLIRPRWSTVERHFPEAAALAEELSCFQDAAELMELWRTLGLLRAHLEHKAAPVEPMLSWPSPEPAGLRQVPLVEPGLVIDRSKHWSVVRSLKPLHGTAMHVVFVPTELGSAHMQALDINVQAELLPYMVDFARRHGWNRWGWSFFAYPDRTVEVHMVVSDALPVTWGSFTAAQRSSIETVFYREDSKRLKELRVAIAVQVARLSDLPGPAYTKFSNEVTARPGSDLD